MAIKLTHTTYDNNQPIIILYKEFLDFIYSQENSVDLLSLYIFYRHNQWDDITKCTDSYTAQKLKWGIHRVRNTKNQLIQLGLIQ